MQSAAKKQEDMYKFILGGKGPGCEVAETEVMEEEVPMTI
jgi:hypothetical protein